MAGFVNINLHIDSKTFTTRSISDNTAVLFYRHGKSLNHHNTSSSILATPHRSQYYCVSNSISEDEDGVMNIYVKNDDGEDTIGWLSSGEPAKPLITLQLDLTVCMPLPCIIRWRLPVNETITTPLQILNQPMLDR